jgi:hypothetical protein
MPILWTLDAFNTRCGDLAPACLTFITETYPFAKVVNGELVLNVSLAKIFDEPMELFSVDPSLVSDNFTINDMFRDETIHPDVITTLMDLISDLVDYDPIGQAGDLWMSFEDLRFYYGNTFDDDMSKVYPNYQAFKDYFSD